MLPALATLCLLAASAAAADFSTWNCKMKIAFPDYGRAENLVNFPALVVLDESLSGFSYGDFASVAGADLRFGDATETSELNYEIEKWNTNGESYVWVKVPGLVSTGTYVWAYWGKPAAAAPAYTTNGATWSQGYAAVWHLGTSVKDSSANAHHAVTVLATNAVGMIAGGRGFDGSDYIDFDAFDINDAFTISLWIKPSSLAAGQNWIGKHSGSGGNQLLVGGYGTGQYLAQIWGESYGAVNLASGWQHVVAVGFGSAGSTAVTFYRNGQKLWAQSLTDVVGDVSGGLGWTLGQDWDAGPVRSDYYTGLMDEVRVSQVTRSSNWVWACWMNAASNDTFVSCGPVLTHRTLSVNSLHGAPNPSVGIHTNWYGAVVPCMANSPFSVNRATQYVCTGWTLTGNEPVSGTNSSFVLTPTNNAVLTWWWGLTNVFLEVETVGRGTLDAIDGWHPRNTNVTITASPMDGCYLAGWAGDTNDCTPAGNQIVVPMSQRRRITAHFGLGSHELVVRSEYGGVQVTRTDYTATRHDVSIGPDGMSAAVTADVDGDGDMDILAAAEDLHDILWWENINGHGTNWIKHTVDAHFAWARSVYAADVDGDGDMDVLGAAASALEIAWWENNDGRGTNWTWHRVNAAFGGASSVRAADVDGDGDMDVLGAAVDDNHIAWWENTDGHGTNWTQHSVDRYFYGAFSVCAGDVDGDGDMDVLGAADIDDDIAWWENTDGHGTNWIEHTVEASFDGACSVHAADVDGDGDMDVLGAAASANDITWWENADGRGTNWTEHTVDGAFGGAISVYAADVDGDGDMDVLGAAYMADNITWWENTDGSGTNWIENTVAADGSFDGPHSVYTGDVDGDGDQDVLAAGWVSGDGEVGTYGVTWWEIIPGSQEVGPWQSLDSPVATNLIVNGRGTVCRVSPPAVETGTTQYVCTGWTATGSAPPSGATNNTGTFAATNDTILTWTWGTNFYFSHSAGPHGRLLADDEGWYSWISVVAAAAVPDLDYEFVSWTGDVPDAKTNVNVVVLMMDRPRSILAHFIAVDTDGDGMPDYWERIHSSGPTNMLPAIHADSDGFDNLSEFIADTDPTNDASYFHINAIMVSSNCMIGFESSSNRIYDLRYITDLVTGQWDTVQGQSNIPGNPSGTTVLTDTNRASACAYRVKVRVP